jgi:NADH-ubiquinone oxidoreductase chain 4
MLLARLLLKLGGYGLIRVGYFFLVKFSYGKIIYLWVSLRIFLVGIMCLRKIDFKSLIAYSSIVHMSLGVLSLLLLRKIRVQGALLVFVAHGLCSSGLFFIVTDFYKRSGCRNLVLKTGVLHIRPLLISL